MVFRGSFTDKEKLELNSSLPSDWIVTKNHLGFWARSPGFKWDEVLAGDTIAQLVKRVKDYLKN